MNQASIYSKTGKGMQEASGRTSFLPRATRKILNEIDGKSPLLELAMKFPELGGGKLEAAVAQMEREGFIRELASSAAAAAPAPARPQAPTPPPADDGDELDFTAAISSGSDAARGREDAGRKAKEGAERTAKATAALKARLDAEQKAKAMAEAQARVRALTEAKAKAEAAARAKALAEEQARANAQAEAKAKAEAEAKAKAAAEAKARADAEARAKAEAEAKAKAETEARAKAEAEAKALAEAEALARLEAERKAKEEAERIAREAEARARREAEEKARREADELRAKLEEERRAREEAERAAREAEERARREAEERTRREAEERTRREAEEKARREADELRAKLEEERRAREEAERAAREAEERARREAEERVRREVEEKARREAELLREQIEQERKAREEAERRAKEEAERRAKEEAERRAKEEAERRAKEEAERRAKEEAERRAKEEAERRAKEEAERKQREADEAARAAIEAKSAAASPASKPEAQSAFTDSLLGDLDSFSQREGGAGTPAQADIKPATAAVPPPAKPAGADEFADSLLGDLDSFSQREDEAAKKKEEEERLRKEAEQKARKEAEDHARQAEEERKRQEETELRRKEAEARQAREEEERRKSEEEERERTEAAERKRKAEESMRRASPPVAGPAAGAAAARASTAKTADDDIPFSEDDMGMEDVLRDQQAVSRRPGPAAPETAPGAKPAHEVEAAPVVAKKPVKWGKPVAIGLFVLLIGGIGLIHVMPLSSDDYAKALSGAIGRPVKIRSVHVSLFTGVELKIDDVDFGEGGRIPRVRASPEVGSLFGAKKVFSQITLDGAVLPQSMLGEVLLGSMQGDGVRVGRLRFSDLQIDGDLALPKLSGEVGFGDGGRISSISLKGGGEAKVSGEVQGQGETITFEINADSATIPFAPALSLSNFGMKGTANRQEANVTQFTGRAFEGILSGNARIRWSGGWNVTGELTAKQMNAAVFAPTLISEGRLEGTGRFALSGSDPAKLGPNGRMEGTFNISKGAIGSVDLSRMLQSTGGSLGGGRTPFSELAARGTYNKGTVELRDIRVNAGLLTATATLDIDAVGNLLGKVNAEVKTASTSLRGALGVSGKLADPVVKR